ncbi:MAG: amino acid ABC transporter permease [Christensenellaceae bacterium]|nr:amino acid ABC transporter permease [Christensenellaceae bacterium]
MTFMQVTSQLLKGFSNTCLIFILTLVMSIPLGLIVMFGTTSKFKPLRWLARTFVWIIRGTPLMLQVMIIFYMPGILFGWTAPERLTAVVIAFVINYACYFSEIYRGGIESISKGQYEAGQVLGMTKSQIFFKIVLLQVIKRIVPPMSNEIITLVKDTSLARVIAYGELIMSAQNILSQKALIWPLFYTGVFYLVFSGVLTIVLGRIEKKLSYFRS